MKYSILIPAYKETFFKECIDSILSQTFCDFELIIVDDASPQNIKGIVDNFDDIRIKYYRNEKNIGAIDLVDNWNLCLSYAKGDYVICMGDDDRLLPNCLETYNQLINDYPKLDIYHGRTIFINDKSENIGIDMVRPAYESVLSLIWHRIKGRSQFIGDFLFKREALCDNGGFYKLPLAWASDNITSYIMATNKGIASTLYPVFEYRINDLTISKTGNDVLKMQAFEQEIQWMKFFLQNYDTSDLLDSIYKKCLIDDMESIHKKKKYTTLFESFQSRYSFCNFIKWFNLRKKYNLSIKMLLYAYFQAGVYAIKNISKK